MAAQPHSTEWPIDATTLDSAIAESVARTLDLLSSRYRAPARLSPATSMRVALVGFGRAGLRTASKLLNSGASVAWIGAADAAGEVASADGDLSTQSWLAYPDHGPRYALPNARLALSLAEVILVGTPRPHDPPAARLVALGRVCSQLVRSVTPGQTIVVTGSCYVGCIRDLLIEPLRNRGLVDGRDISIELCPEWQGLEETVEPTSLARIMRESADAEDVANGVYGTASTEGGVTDAPIEWSARERAIETMERALLGSPCERRLERLAKRCVDVLVAATALALLSPVLLLIALAILLDDGRPILFIQLRAGEGGRLFRFRKFRTMTADAESRLGEVIGLNQIRGPAFQIEHDPRLTRIGGFLRRSSLDELPQLWNVLVGEMSLVGPRPAPTCEVSEYEPWHARRLCVKPGITGLAQITARCYREFDQKAYLDADYIDRWSFWLDVRIMLRTLPAVLRLSGR